MLLKAQNKLMTASSRDLYLIFRRLSDTYNPCMYRTATLQGTSKEHTPNLKKTHKEGVLVAYISN